MAWYNIFKQKEVIVEKVVEVQPYSASAISSPWYPIITKTFDGEKTPGEMGNVINLLPDHVGLRLRAYEQELKSDVVKMITGKFFKWVVGTGLELQAQPNEIVLETEGIKGDFNEFRRIAEARFKVYSNNEMSDFSNMKNLHKLAREAFKTAFLGGDCLVILRVENGYLNCQVIDGQEVQTPPFGSNFQEEAIKRENTIKSGIEVDKRGEHVAFYVVKDAGDLLTDYVRIPAKGETSGKKLAWMIYGTKQRINHVRGIPNITAILEKVEKIDRYTEATVSSAEERAKIAYAVEHSRFSTGENPVLGNLKKNLGGDTEDDPYLLGAELSKNIAATTNKMTFNMPVGSKLASLASNQELNYPDFFEAVFQQLCAAVDIPPEVALQKYDSNYSASRAAINGWGYIVDIYRKDFSHDFYRPFYQLWLELEIINGKVTAPGYLKAIYENNLMAIKAYGNCRFTGINLPHIDPKKEVDAIRRMLGDSTKNEAPLISHERATELLNQGEWSENFKKYQEEDKKIPKNEPNSQNQKQDPKLG